MNPIICRLLPLAAALVAASHASCQTATRHAHASQWMTAVNRGTALPYSYSAPGTRHTAMFGMDTAWDDEGNVRRGTNYIGKPYMGTGRISFQPDYFVDANGQLTESQKSALRSRITHIKLTGVTDVLMNCDHEAMATTNHQYKGKPEEWYRLIKASVRYAQSLGVNVVAVAPFNEPDYTGWNEGSKDDFRTICQLLSQDADFAQIRICAGNTLNCDKAQEWYDYMKPYVSEGNTHQLAGDFGHYAQFFENVRADGNHATADELHNVMEAIVGIEYGMQSGIWWGFDGLARGNFCRANTGEGARLGYAENRSAWSAAGVYRLPDGQVNAILGTSERQSTNSTYQLLSTDGAAYYDGWGPTEAFSIDMPGGNGYQKGQTNAERCIQVVHGDDVPPIAPLEGGTFVIMNKHSKKVIGVQGNTAQAGKTLVQQNYNAAAPASHHHWRVTPVSARVGGDFSYAYIYSEKDTQLLVDVKDWSLGSGGQVMLWNGEGGANEQWYFTYAGNGDFYIRSRHSNHCLEVRSSSTVAGAMIQQGTFTGADNQRWRLLPVGTACETEAPMAPTGLRATPQSHSILLEWDANSESDLAGYDMMRGEATETGDIAWNVIGRSVNGTTFVDNSGRPYITYTYKVRATDAAANRSEASATVEATIATAPTLVAHYTFEGDANDTTPNQMDATANGEPSYQNVQKRQGDHSLHLTGNTYLQLPPRTADHKEITVALWVYWQGGNAWQRIFDFGNGTDQYIFLTPSNGTEMRLAVKNGAEEQHIATTRLGTYRWTHIAVTMGADGTDLYVDGVPAAHSDDIDTRPADFHPTVNFLGCSQFAGDPLFKGCLDDLRIYNHALTPQEVADVMAGNDTGIVHVGGDTPNAKTINYYTIDGQRTQLPRKGAYIIKTTDNDGHVESRTFIKK